MKWSETLIVLVGITTFIQFLKWLFESLGLEEKIGTPLTLFFAIIFTALIILSLLFLQLQKETKKIKIYLKGRGYQEEEGIMRKLLTYKKGEIDARIVIFIIIAALLYLLYNVLIK